MSPYAYLPMLTHLVCHHTLTYQSSLFLTLPPLSSISGVELKEAHQFAMRVVDNFVVNYVDPSADARVGLIAYTSDAKVAFDLGAHKTNGAVKVALDALPTGEMISFTVTFCANPANDLTCPPSYINI